MEPQFAVFKTVLMYSLFILLAPIFSFFISKFIVFQGTFGLDTLASNVWSAIFAVIVLHIALGLYIYRAYFEAETVKPTEKID